MTSKYYYSYTCFNCRKSFKRPPPKDRSDVKKCPECHRTMAVMGRKFRTPKQSDLKQWKKIQILYEAGFPVGFSRPSDMDPYPDELYQVTDFIRANWQKRYPQLFKNPMPGIDSYPETLEEIEIFLKKYFG